MKKICILLAILLSSCSSVDISRHDQNLASKLQPRFDGTPELKKFRDNYWMLVKDFTFYIGEEVNGVKPSIKVPAGFVYDLASFPKPLSFLNRDSYNSAALIHDYHFWVQPCVEHTDKKNRKIANKIFKQSLKSSGHGKPVSFMLKHPMSKFSSCAWRKNQRRRKRGECRFVPENLRGFSAESVSWKSYKAQACKNGVSLKPSEQNPEYCNIFEKWPKHR